MELAQVYRIRGSVALNHIVATYHTQTFVTNTNTAPGNMLHRESYFYQNVVGSNLSAALPLRECRWHHAEGTVGRKM